MPCTANFPCHTHKTYIESGGGGKYYHGELCDGCMWWEDSEEDIAYWDKLEMKGIKRRVNVGYKIKPDIE